jgi:hypothetical protein
MLGCLIYEEVKVFGPAEIWIEVAQHWGFKEPDIGMQATNQQDNVWFLLPSGKHTKNCGKSPFLMGKSTINGKFQ